MYCPQCSNLFDITQALPTQSGGGAFEDLIDKILRKETITHKDVASVPLGKFFRHIAYKKLNYDDRNYVYNIIQDALPEDKKKMTKRKVSQDTDKDIAYHRCSTCRYTKRIKPGMLIYSKESSNTLTNYQIDELSDMLWDDTAPRTRNYQCPNKKCKSHTHPEKREAVFFRMGESPSVTYVCALCRAVFQ